MSNWRTICQRLAPTATRTLISLDRPAALARSRLATFEQAISSTNPTAPSNAQKSNEICGPRMRSTKGSACGQRSLFVSGYCAAKRRADGLELGARLFDGHAVVETPDRKVTLAPAAAVR